MLFNFIEFVDQIFLYSKIVNIPNKADKNKK